MFPPKVCGWVYSWVRPVPAPHKAFVKHFKLLKGKEWLVITNLSLWVRSSILFLCLVIQLNFFLRIPVLVLCPFSYLLIPYCFVRALYILRQLTLCHISDFYWHGKCSQYDNFSCTYPINPVLIMYIYVQDSSDFSLGPMKCRACWLKDV